MPDRSRWLFGCGVVSLAALAAAARLDARVETGAFLGLVAVAALAYLGALYLIARSAPLPRRVLAGCLLLGLAWRVALMAGAPLASDDVYRYVWDGRVQRFGHNPFEAVPDDPALAGLHTDLTRRIDPTSAALPSIYPPAAQLLFRGVTAAHESVGAMVVAVVAFDLATVVLLRRFLVSQGRSPTWVLAYAWHPLVAIEGAGGAHIDLVGTTFVVGGALALASRRTFLASVALAIAVLVKFLPLVLAPLLWKRVGRRDLVAAAAVIGALYLPFTSLAGLPVGSLGAYAGGWRFNGPLFAGIEAVAGTVAAVVVAVAGGLAVGVWARVRLGAAAPAAWAWPMATTLLFMPAVYPWYLVWLTPFLTTRGTWPLAIWSVASLGTYVVWSSQLGGVGWVLPIWVQPLEYGALAGAVLMVWWNGRHQGSA